MKNALFLLIAVTTLFVGCMPCARCHAQGNLDTPIGNHDKNYNSGQRVDALAIPADQKPWLTLIVSDNYENSPRDKEVNTWFHIHPRLIKIREAVNFTCMYVSDPRYAATPAEGGMGSAYGNITPAVGLTRAVAFPGEKNLPKLMFAYENGPLSGAKLKNPDVLADEIYAALSRAYPAPKFDGQIQTTPIVKGPCPPDGCDPTPPNKPWKPNPNPVVQPLEVVQPNKVEDLILIGSVIGGFVLMSVILIVGLVALARRQTPAPAGDGSLL